MLKKELFILNKLEDDNNNEYIYEGISKALYWLVII